MDADCYYGDHEWRGGSRCIRWGCDARLRCMCGRFVRESEMDHHVADCDTVRRNAIFFASGIPPELHGEARAIVDELVEDTKET